MAWNEILNYGLLLLIPGYLIWRWYRLRTVRGQIPVLIRAGAVIVDVRSSGEFSGAHRPGSLNIPLDRMSERWHELDKSKPVILCCASGTRSAMAAAILKKNGFANVLNAGPWRNTLS